MRQIFMLVLCVLAGIGLALAGSGALKVTLHGKEVNLSTLSKDELAILARLTQKASGEKSPAICF